MSLCQQLHLCYENNAALSQQLKDAVRHCPLVSKMQPCIVSLNELASDPPKSCNNHS